MSQLKKVRREARFEKMVDRQVFIEKSTAGGRNLEKLKDGFSLLACIDYPIEYFDELFGKLQADYIQRQD